MSGRIALVGSGEYLPVMQDIEAWLLEDRPKKFVQLATAASLEGERSLNKWHTLGRESAERLGAEQVVLDIRTRADAELDHNVAALEDAGLIYLSGGNPGHLARTLRGTKVWKAIRNQWSAGASIAGCSAGAMALCHYVPEFRHPKSGGEDGLGLIMNARVIPHFDRYSRFIPDFVLKPLLVGGEFVIGIDENTALISDGTKAGHNREWEFRSRGIGSSWRIESDRKHRINGSLDLLVDSMND
jgi:cyanophycinase-like exopeptidase